MSETPHDNAPPNVKKGEPQIRNYAPNMIQKWKESASLVKRGHSASNVTIKTVESITDESLESNCSIIEKIPPKGESFSDFIATFAMSVGFDTYFDLQH